MICLMPACVLADLPVFTATEYYDAFTPEERTFALTVQTHFQNARSCWKQKVVPGKSLTRKLINETVRNCRRFWPQDPDMLYSFFTLIISESGGNNIGNPDDPSYGVCHATYESARNACKVFGFEAPKAKYLFKEKLQEDVAFNLLCGAGELKLAMAYCNNDKVRGILAYKYGVKGLNRAINSLGDEPITELSVWKNYVGLYEWIRCLRDRVITNADANCGCLTPMPVKK